MKKIFSKFNISAHTVAWSMGSVVAVFLAGYSSVEAYLRANGFNMQNERTQAYLWTTARHSLPIPSATAGLLTFGAIATKRPSEGQINRLLKKRILSGEITADDLSELLSAEVNHG